MKFICPLLVVEDIARSRAFYEGILGQKVKVDFGENVTFEGDFAIHLKTHFRDLLDGKEIRPGQNQMEIYFEENELESLEQLLKDQNVVFAHPVREQPWRQRVMRFYDPDGHLIEAGESMEYLCYRLHLEGLSLSEISGTTYMPEALVTRAIEQYST